METGSGGIPVGPEPSPYDFKVEVSLTNQTGLVQTQGYFDQNEERFDQTIIDSKKVPLLAYALLFAVNKLRNHPYFTKGKKHQMLTFKEVFGDLP